VTNENVPLARALNDATDFLMKYADLPYFAAEKSFLGSFVESRSISVEFQLLSNDNRLTEMITVSRVLQCPVVIASHDQYYEFAVITSHASTGIRVWTHLKPAEAMKLFLRLGIDPETELVELDAETLAKAVEPDGGAER
jgi:hypothetical protein